MEFKDYYNVLGVQKSASADEIRAAYRKRARRYHPDVNPGDESSELKFKELNEANEVLGNPETRRKYDQLGANWRQYENMPPGAGGPFRGAGPVGGFGGRPGGRTMSEDEIREMFGAGPFSDFFQTFFAGTRQSGTHRQQPHAQRGRDVEHVIELALEQAYRGVTQRLSVRPVGAAARNVDVRIPAGVTDGARVRVSGKGEAGIGDGPAGDLYLRVRLKPHPTFQCKGYDLLVKMPVSVTTAVLGGEIDVPTLDGAPVRLKIPGATQPGQMFRIKGRGMPVPGPTKARGDLYATVEVTVPDRLSAAAREHYEALAALESTSCTAQDAGTTRQSVR